MKKKDIALIPLFCLFVAASGCFMPDNDYRTAEEEYVMGWVLHNVNDSTGTVLDYSYANLSIYTYTYNYPAYVPLEYSDIFFWLQPVPYNMMDADVVVWTKLGVPLNRTYYVMGVNPVPEYYFTNWSFSKYIHINYLPAPDGAPGGYENPYRSNQVETYRSESGWHAITPVPGDRRHIYFGTAPYTPPSLFVSNNTLKLRDHLLRGYGGKSYLLKNSRIYIDYPDTYVYVLLPVCQIYLNNSLVYADNLTVLSKGLWSYGKLNYSLDSDGLYFINLTIPSGYPVWNITRVLAYIRKPSQDLTPPTINHLEVPPRFVVNKSVGITVNATDESNISSVSVYFNTGSEADEWSELDVGFNNLLYNTSLTITNSSVSTINLMVNITDTFNNTVTYVILPASMRARPPSIDFTSSDTIVKRRDRIWVSGNCSDEFGLNCTGFRLEYYLDSVPLGRDYVSWGDTKFSPGGFGSFLQIPANFSSTTANLSVTFNGTGVYPPSSKQVDINVALNEHDIAVNSVTVGGGRRVNQTAIINVSLYNVGLSDEPDVYVRLYVDGNLTESIHCALNATQSGVLAFNWTPLQYGVYHINVSSDPVSGETDLTDNSIQMLVLIGPDISGRLIISDYTIGYNESTYTVVRIVNVGNETASNVTVHFYTVDSYQLSWGLINESSTMTFQDTQYNITAHKINSGLSLDISYGNLSEEHILYPDQFVELKNGVLLEWDNVGPTSYSLYLENATPRLTQNLVDFEPNMLVDENVNWTPHSLGTYWLRLHVEASDDCNLTNNYFKASINSKQDMPDLQALLSWPYGTKLVVNQTNSISVHISNGGLQPADNVSSVFTDIYDLEDGYMLYYNETSWVCYNATGTCYNMTVTAIDDEADAVTLSIPELNSTELVLYLEQTMRLGDNLSILVRNVWSSQIQVYVGRSQTIQENIGALNVGEMKYTNFSFVPVSLGYHYLTAAGYPPEDNSWRNNFDSARIEAIEANITNDIWINRGWNLISLPLQV